MKKLFVFMSALFIGVLTANARIDLNESQCVASETSQNPQTCPLTVKLTENVIKKGDGLTVVFHTPKNIKNNSITITPATGWKLRKLGDEEYKDTLTLTISTDLSYVEFKYEGDADIAISNAADLASVSYDKEDIGEGCGFRLNFPLCSKPTVGEKDYYFGITGSTVTKEEWEDQCTCQVRTINNAKWYYSKDGDAKTPDENTSADTLAENIVKECYTCQKVEFDGKTYFMGKTGLVESEEAMNEECFPKCKVVDDKYYDKDGKEISKDEYKKQCMCRIEDTKDGKIYYNDKNEVITADEYTNQCQPSVPTGASVPYMLIFGGAALCGVTLIFILRNKSKLKRI